MLNRFAIRKLILEVNIKIASGELVVRLGEKGPLVPVSQLEILPGQFWRNKTEMPEIASNTPQENHRRIVTDAAALFGFGSKEKEILVTTLFSRN